MIRFDKFGQGYFLFAEFEKSGTTTKTTINKISVAKHLTDDEYKLFLRVYQLHNRSMGLSEREKYTLSHIVKIERCNKGKCLRVHYDNGDWWYYSAYGTWY